MHLSKQLHIKETKDLFNAVSHNELASESKYLSGKLKKTSNNIRQ